MSFIKISAARCVSSALMLAATGLTAGVVLAAGLAAPASIRLALPADAFDSQRHLAATYDRIRNASRGLCGDSDRVFPQERAAWDHCVAVSIQRAVQEVGNPALSEFYLRKLSAAERARGDGFLAQFRRP
jgi:UrcA family protein